MLCELPKIWPVSLSNNRSLIGLLLAVSLWANHANAMRIHTSGDENFSQLLGFGVDSNSRQIRQHCIVGTPRLFPQKELGFRVHFAKDFDELLQSRRGSGAVGVSIWLVGAKARQEFFLRNSTSQNRISMIWEIDYHLGTLALENRELSLIGRGASLRESSVKHQICGDRFIDHVKLGAKAYLAASIHFASEEAYQQFKTKVTVSFLGGLIRSSKTFIKTFESFEEQAWLTIDALQMGGPSLDLDNPIGEGPLYCNQQNLELCASQFQRIHDYIFSEDGYQRDLKNQNLSEYYPLYYGAADYRESNHEQLESSSQDHINGDDLEQETRILLEIDRLVAELSRLNFEQASIDEGSPQHAEYQLAIENLRQEINSLQSKLSGCAYELNCPVAN